MRTVRIVLLYTRVPRWRPLRITFTIFTFDVRVLLRYMILRKFKYRKCYTTPYALSTRSGLLDFTYSDGEFSFYSVTRTCSSFCSLSQNSTCRNDSQSPPLLPPPAPPPLCLNLNYHHRPRFPRLCYSHRNIVTRDERVWEGMGRAVVFWVCKYMPCT